MGTDREQVRHSSERSGPCPELCHLFEDGCGVQSPAVELLVSFSYDSISAGFKISMDKFDGYTVQILINQGFSKSKKRVKYCVKLTQTFAEFGMMLRCCCFNH